MDAQRVLWPRVRKEFFDDLRFLHERSGPWDVVLFSGDLTQRGATDEFAALDAVLERLWELLADMQPEPILVAVPGNHDLVRPGDARSAAFRALVQLWRRDPVVREEFWSNPQSDYRQMIDRAFAPFSAWRARWYDEHPPPARCALRTGELPGDFSLTVEKDQLRLGIVGLNSAFLQLADGDFRGRLELDARQLLGVCGDDPPEWFADRHASFLMTHHPPEWLHPGALAHFHAELAPSGQFLVHLCGHLHEGLAHAQSLGGSPTERLLQGASLFGLETFGEGEDARMHGYSAGRLSLSRRSGKLRLWPRRMERAQSGKLQMVQDTTYELDRESQALTLPFTASRWLDPPSRRFLIQRRSGEVQAVRAAALGDAIAEEAAAGGVAMTMSPEPQAPGESYREEWCVPRLHERIMALTHLRNSRKPVVLWAPELYGKTWMFRRLLGELRESGGDTLIEINLEELERDALDGIEPLLKELALRIAVAAGRNSGLVEQEWRRNGGVKNKVTRLLEDHLLPSVSGRLLLAIEHADAVWGRESGDDFYTLLRSWAERSEYQDVWSHFRMLLTSSVEPTHLIRNAGPSPFNIAKTIRLGDFDAGQTEQLAALHRLAAAPEEIVELRRLVGGHPYLLRLAMYEAATTGRALTEVVRDGLSFADGIFAEHLRERRSLLERSPWSRAAGASQAARSDGLCLLDAVCAIRRDPELPLDLDSALRLQSAGVVVEETRGVFQLRNDLYRRYFETLCRAH
jgi:3',5'-cyclic AMP phosphodiesterase CpdA